MARSKRKQTKRTLKFLTGCSDRDLTKHVLRKADKQVVKGICNAAYNVTQGEIPLTRGQKQIFCRYRPVLAALTSPNLSLDQKQKKIQKGGAFGAILAAVLPTLLGTVLSAVGSSLFQKNE